ncbi:MAG: hypothetical protein V1720_09765 [bacterium]
MKILALTTDKQVIEYLSREEFLSEHKVHFSKENSNPLDILSEYCTVKPSLLILDNDLMQSSTLQILHSIKKIDKNVSTIFITSDSSIELGREITPSGVQFYGIKPLEEKEFFDAINSIIQMKLKFESNSLS